MVSGEILSYSLSKNLSMHGTMKSIESLEEQFTKQGSKLE